MKVRLYARVSTKLQEAEIQLNALREYAAKQGWEVVGEHVDKIPGDRSRAKRPGFDAICTAMEKKQCDVVLVWSVDRIARSVHHFSTFMEVVKKTGVNVVFHQQPSFSTTDPIGRIFLQQLSLFGELEKIFISARVKETIAYGKSIGKSYGKPKKWTNDQIEDVRKLRATGYTAREIAQVLGMGLGTVGRIIKEAA